MPILIRFPIKLGIIINYLDAAKENIDKKREEKT